MGNDGSWAYLLQSLGKVTFMGLHSPWRRRFRVEGVPIPTAAIHSIERAAGLSHKALSAFSNLSCRVFTS